MNRGHGGERVLASEARKQEYLRILQAEVKRFRVPIHGYCLIDNHYHLIIESKVLGEYERRIGKPIEKIDAGCYEGKRQRAELLVLLKDMAGITYRDILEIEVFRELAFSSFGSIYAGEKKKRTERT